VRIDVMRCAVTVHWADRGVHINVPFDEVETVE